MIIRKNILKISTFKIFKMIIILLLNHRTLVKNEIILIEIFLDK